MAKEMIKDASNAITKEIANARSKADFGVIREDIDTLKEDARVMAQDAKTLGRHLKDEGREQLSHAEERAREALDHARERGKDGYAELTNFVRNNPGQSIAFAFVGGMLASVLFGRRG